MSKFITSIPVDFDALNQNVPPNTFIESVRLSADKKSVEVEWDHPALIGPVAGHWPFPIEHLRAGTLPERVKYADWAKPKELPAEAPETPNRVNSDANAVNPKDQTPKKKKA